MAKDKMVRQRKLSPEELSSFCEQIALMLDSGMTLYDGIEMLAAEEKEGDRLYGTILQGMHATGSLYEALRQDSSWPQYMVQMVGIGEETGRLEDIMLSLSQYYEREGRIRSAASSAITYPLVLGAMLVVIILVLLWRVLPVFNRVLDSLGVSGTESGSLLMHLGAVVGWVVLAVIAVLGVAALVCLVLMKTSHKDKVMALIQRIFPPLRRINRKLSSARVASMLSLMLSSGYPMESALEMAPYALTDKEAARRVEGIRAAMAEGATFSEALSASELFEDFHNRMIRVGAASGHEPQVMAKIAGIYEEQVEEGFTRLVAIIEPTLVALLSVVIGAILLSVMMPMAGILSNLP
ncbi:MAG: type II secretion system F family protein [Clostridiales bacterium]|nr:type II secretion system F family protein [Clostridiales bacterium]